MKMSRRYPGVSPFTPDQGKIFFGRDNDIKKLSRLIMVRKQVLLYSKSGIGKSSLLNAGVMPTLLDKYIPIPVRFFAYNQSSHRKPVDSIIAAMKETIKDGWDDDTLLDRLSKGKAMDDSLWALFKKLALSGKVEGGKKGSKEYILVFDQFEELFTYPEEEINEFKDQVYEVSRVDVPDRIMEVIAGDESIEDDDDYDRLLDRLDLKMVFVIRSDRLNLLNKLSDRIPDIQKIYYELEPLDESQARQAIINPAMQDDDDFEVKPFRFDDDAVDSIIEALTSNDDGTIETTQLQIVCQTIEEIALTKQQAGEGNVVIKRDDLPDFKDIFLRFYNDSVNKTGEPEKAKLFIEDQLIRNAQRISLDYNICLDYVSKETLTMLENTHLLRAEQNNVGGKSYELSHDTLLEPILEVKKVRLEEEARQEAERKRQEELRLYKEKQAKRMRRARAIFLTVSAIGLGVTIIFYIYKQNQLLELRTTTAELEKAEAERQAMIARQQAEIDRLRLDSLAATTALLEARSQQLESDNVALTETANELTERNEALIKNSQIYRQAVRKLDVARTSLEIARYQLELYKKVFRDAGDLNLSRAESGKYGYVSRNGKVKIDYEFDDAEPFEMIGLARVERGGTNYFIDLKRNEYLVTSDVDEISGDVTALDLSGKRLSDVPGEIFDHDQIEILLLDDNRLDDLPIEIENMTRLKFLGISGNKGITDERKKELIELLGGDVNIRF